jgi:hypothetical protein
MSSLSNADFAKIYATSAADRPSDGGGGGGGKRKSDHGEDGGHRKKPANKGKFVPAHLRKWVFSQTPWFPHLGRIACVPMWVGEEGEGGGGEG